MLASLAGAADVQKPKKDGPADPTGVDGPAEKIELRIVFDNNVSDDRFENEWGFGCVITGSEKTILFDTGLDGAMLLRNLDRAEIDPEEIDAVVLSHIHGDHTGGLAEFLKVNRDVEVYLPKAFPAEFKAQVCESAMKVIETDSPQKVCECVCTTGVLGRRIPEQGIYVRTAEGIVVITGCAHPGIVEMTEAAKAHSRDSVRFVLGGFHLGGTSEEGVEQIVDGLKKLGVMEVAPTHCTGDGARKAMKEAFGDCYVSVGAGARMVFPAAKPPAKTQRSDAG